MVQQIVGKVKPVDIEEEMKKSYLDYSMSVIVGRALPDVRDGLKPVHRRILYAMYDMGITNDKPHKKSARITGETLGKYHPHGDTAVYDALVRMAQDFSLRYLLIDGHGNFGSVDGDSPAAMRYTEARLSSLSMEMLRDINKDTVEFVDNFDGSLKEPGVLPCKFPNLLINGSSGIAVGMATNMPPHNLNEVVDGIIAYIDDPKISLKKLMKKIKGPDFPTAGLILGTGGIKEAYETGKGKITVRAKTHLETMKSKKKRIVITELPYQVNKANLIRKIAELVRGKKIEGIYDLRDESDRSGMRVVIELKKESQPYVILNNLYKHTQLQDTFGIINIALVDGVPKLMTIHEIIDNYIKHQFNVVTRLTKYELRKAKNRAHILDGILIALANLDKVIKLIKTSKTVTQARQRLIKNFKLTTIQAQAILDMKLQRLTGLERDKVQKEHKQLLEKIRYCEKVLSDKKLVYQIIKKDLRDIVKRFGDERRTIITPTEEEIDIEDLIAEEDMIVTITHSGYIKRIPVTTYRKQRRGGIGVMGMNLKEDDFVEHLFISSTHQFMLFFTNRGKVYKIKTYGLPTGGRTSKGKSIRNFFNFSYNERIEMVITTDNFKFKEFIMMVTKNGLIKKTELSQYKNASRGGLIAINLKKKDEIVGVSRIKPMEEVILISANGKGIRFGENQIRATSRNTMGVRAMRFNKGDRILSMGIAIDDTDLLLITKNGYGKRTAISEYKVQKRGGKGVIAIKTDSKTGKLIGCKVVRKNNELVLISNEGTLIRVSVDSIRKVGRQARGVKVMKLREGDKVSSLAKVVGG